MANLSFKKFISLPIEGGWIVTGDGKEGRIQDIEKDCDGINFLVGMPNGPLVHRISKNSSFSKSWVCFVVRNGHNITDVIFPIKRRPSLKRGS